ncbi:hypothetical protein GLW07_14560 [Bacillus hwajinpoensis]|jgi:hypothetical protein|uniref:Uncharacterized protein n=1 Tax=Guptibacillus hwajinpoensis TaxID=208199 RepID=A0A845F1J7_9BACL|nr:MULTISPECIES: hypothetical protein [Bacillaceae]MYL64576.1 hypothetical protein [Pseudalkalibacillus hwajinpoensis]PFG12486.1 hypothetical protein ATG70_0670 [Bacillus sp. es.036]
MELSFGLILNIVIAIYLFVDAKKRDKSSFFWAIIGLIFGPIVLGIYFIQTGRKGIGWLIIILALIWFIIAIVLGILAGIIGLLF